jgi:quinol-cytochrome oxidoreductase complex cytochrome b subunit/mono/diheme cytochrome c family protein
VFARLRNWLDNRTGYRKLVQALLLEHVPGGAKWRYVWGSCLAFVFAAQVITGILLMMAYSPGDTSAWGSVYFIQYEMEFGWLIRGLHHFGSQAMVVLLAVHLLQVVIAGAHLAPREINWWLGLALMGLVLAMSLTGYLLPWDQKGYYATQVATNIAGDIPGIGGFLRLVIVGGPEYGNHTLTRFYALHVAIVPALIVVLLIAHIAVFRRHGVTAPKGAEGEGLFWPDQAFKDMVASMIIFAILLGVVIWGGQGNAVEHTAFRRTPAEKRGLVEEPDWWQRVALGGRDGRGANLDAPAVPGGSYPARPEWYFLFLYQLLKSFPDIRGTVLIPNGVGLLLFLLPLFGIGRLRTFGHVFGVIVVVSLLTAVSSLTCLALADDTADPLRRRLLTLLAHYAIPATGGFFLLYLGVLAVMRRGGVRSRVSFAGGLVALLLLLGNGSLIFGAMSGALPEPVWSLLESQRAAQSAEERRHEKQATKKATDFRHKVEKAEEDAHRAVEVAAAGIPVEGAVLLLQRDPKTQGPQLFKLRCGSCHSYNLRNDHDDFHTSKDRPTFRAGDLAGFGSKEWIKGLLRDPDSPRYFGLTKLKKGPMSEYVHKEWQGSADKLKKADPKEHQRVSDRFAAVAGWLATHPDAPPKGKEEPSLLQGWKVFKADCLGCHPFAGQGGTRPTRLGPDLTGYGSQEWLRFTITDPHDPLRYGRTSEKRPWNAMPLFRDKDGLTWPAQSIHLERQRQALREPLLQKGQKEAEQELVGKVGESLSREQAQVVGLGAPSGLAPLPVQLAASGTAWALQVQLREEAAKRLEDARSNAEVPPVVKARIEGKIAEATQVMQLTDVERELIIRWLTRDYRVVFGGAPITGPKRR